MVAPGQIIRGYELKKEIASGGFGAVYHAFQSSVGREVAIKAILPQHTNNPQFIRRFEREAQMVTRLEHPAIVPLYDYWRDSTGTQPVLDWKMRTCWRFWRMFIVGSAKI